MKSRCHRKFSKKRCQRASSRRRQRPLFELLEQRQMLATDILSQAPIGIVGEAVREIALNFSAPLMFDSARDQGNYRLTYFGANGVAGGGDDVVLPVLPQYAAGSTMLRLSTLADLSRWTETDYGFPHGILGDWQLDASTGSVVQTVNGGATFFTSDSDLIDREFAAQLEVQTAIDDDFIGVVFGLKADAATELPESYYLLAWKKTQAGGASGGLRLARIAGTGEMGQRPDLWQLSSSDPHITLLATGPNAAWASGVRYEFRVLQEASGGITLSVKNADTGANIWSTSLADPNPLGRGKVGFYNFSQQNVRHWSLQTTGSLPQGNYQFEIFGNANGLLDAAGNPIDGDANGSPGGNYVRTFTVDIGVPTIEIDLQAASDTGVSASDNLTKDNTPTFDITGNRGGLVEIYIDSGLNPIASISFAGAGTQAWTAPALSDGGHTIRTRFTPDLGNPVESLLNVVIDTAGPHLLSGSATEQAPLFSRTIKFSEAIDSLATAPGVVISLLDPDGTLVPLSSASGAADAYTFTFAPQVKPGQYVLSANTAIVDPAGNAVDQDRDGTGGEIGQDEPIDRFTLVVDAVAPQVTRFAPLGTRNTNVSQWEIDFSEPLLAGTFTTADISLIGPLGPINTAGFTVTPTSNRTFLIGVGTLAAEGQYTVGIGPQVQDLSGNAMTAAYQATFTIDKTGPRIISAVPGGDITSVVDHVDVVFSEPLTTSTFTSADISLFGPSGQINGPFTVQALGSNAYRIGFAEQRANGSYMLAAGPNIADAAGNLMDQNRDGIAGDGANDAFIHGFNLLLPDLTVDDSLKLRNSQGAIASQLRFNESIAVSWTVSNAGAQSAFGPITDRIWLSTDSNLSADDILLGSRTLPVGSVVGIGGSYDGTVATQLPGPGGRLPGLYYVIVETDATKGVAESNEQNNTRAAAVELINPPLPDLVAQNIVPVGALTPGLPFTLNWQIDNIGSEPATGPWTERVYISNSPTGSNRQLLGSFIYNSTVAPADPLLPRSESITLPQTSLNGAVYFVVEVDATNNVVESDESNFFVSTASVAVPAVLALSFTGTSVTEAGASLQGTITRNGDAAQPLVVTLTPSIAGQLLLPGTVTIPAGQYSQRFDIAAVVDGMADGNVQVLITASAPSFAAAARAIDVIDVDRGTLTLTAEATSITEGGGLLVTVSRAVASNQPLLVSLATTSGGQIVVPAGVLIPANEKSAQFTLQTVNDSLPEKVEAATFTATAAGFNPTQYTVQVLDDDLPTLSLTLSRSSILESDNSHPIVATVRRQTVTNADLRVRLTSSDTSEAVVPSEVVIPAGQATVTFLITPVDDAILDGAQQAIIRAYGTYTSCGCTITTGFGEAIVDVLDDESPALFIDVSNELVREGLSPAGQITITRNTMPPTGSVLVALTSSKPAKLVFSSPIVEIPAGQASVTVPFSTIGDGVTTGDEVITITATTAGLAAAVRTITVTDVDVPDLVVTQITLPITGLTVDSANVSWTTRNNGQAAANGTWTERVFLSSDNAVGNDILVGQYTYTGPVGPGQAYTRTAPIQLPAIPGKYWLVVQTDVADVVREGLESNNSTVSSSFIEVAPAYSATVMTDVEMAPADTPVLLTGVATRANGSPAAFQEVKVHVSVRGTKRVLPAVTKADGTFQVVFTPLPGEGGNYTIGAAHPGLADAPVQDSFKLVGMRAEPPSKAITVTEAAPAKSDSLIIRNLADVPLTGLAVQVLDAPANLQVIGALAGNATTLGAMGALTLTYTVAGANPSVLDGTFRLRITSNEAPAITVPVSFQIIPLVSRLVADPGSLNKSMLVGDQTSVEFSVTNTGGKATGQLSVLLPTGADWLSLATPATIPSLAPGASTSITLLLTPPEALALTAYNGSLIVRGDATQVSVPFSFRAVSEETGDLEITVVDEFFFFTAEKPLVTNATVILRDAITGAKIISSADVPPPPAPGSPEIAAVLVPPTVSIDSSGRVKFSGVPEGPYTLEVSADKHETYQNTVRVGAGTLSSNQVFISRNLVEYIWTVEEVEIEDRTRITIEAVFETNVPAPVVTMQYREVGDIAFRDGAVFDLRSLQVIGQTKQVEIKITNHGFIAASDVAFDFGSHPFYEITPLIENIGALPAKSEIVVPVLVRRIADFTEDELSEVATLLASGGPIAMTDVPPPSAGVTPPYAAAVTTVPCDIPARLIYSYVCGEKVTRGTPIVIDGVEGDCPPGEPFNPGGGGGGGGGGFFGPGGVSSTPISISKNNCEPAPCFDQFVQTVLCGLPGHCLIGATTSCFVGGFVSSMDAGSAVGNCIISYSLCVFQSFAPLACFIVNGYQLIDCLKTATSGSGGSAAAEVGLLSANDYALFPDDLDQIAIPLSGPVGASLRGYLTWLERYSATLDPLSYLYGDLAWFTDGEKSVPTLTKFHEAMLATSGDGAYVSESEITEMSTLALAANIPQQRVSEMVARWNRSLDYWGQGYATTESLPDGYDENFIDLEMWKAQWIAAADVETQAISMGFQSVGEGFEETILSAREAVEQFGSSGGVCSTVRIQIVQEAVLTRSGFEASLELINNSLEDPIEEIAIDVQVFDSNGNDVTDLFGVAPPRLTGITAIDGNGVLAEDSIGTARWTLIPSTEAAPSTATQYFVGGSLSYRLGDAHISTRLLPVSITVHPQPELNLDYFLQRDVISDDPHTEEIEAAQPFSLAVLVQNNGAGEARNLRIESAQPKIVENEKGLLIDFEITGTKVNGGDVQRSLTANFGTINPGAIAIAEWQMEASLQGLFTEYSATFEHLSPFGDNRLSLIKSVEIHELIHVVDATQVDGGDGLPDFLVNDLADPQDLPDTLYLSGGSVIQVGLGAGANIDAPPTLGDLQVALQATMPAGWAYLKLADPSAGDLKLIGVRRSDGTMVPVQNFWQTDRTFIGGGQRPVLEDKIHLLDYNSTGQYTLIFSNGDLTGPEVVTFAGVVPNPTTQAIDVIDVTFTERLNDASFGTADLALTKNGASVALSGLTVTHVSGSTYRISGLAPFTSQDAVYELEVNAAGLTDQVGNAGLSTKAYRWVKGETAPTVLSLSGAPSGLVTQGPASIDVVFSKPIVGLDIGDLTLTRGGTNLLDAQVTIAQVGASTYRIGNLARLTGVDGPYLFSVNAAGVQDGVGNVGLGAATAEWTLDATAPQLLDVIDPATNPRNIVVQQIDVEFSEAIDLATLDVGDLRLVRNGGVENLIAGDSRVTFESRGNNVYRIHGINWVQAFVAEPQVATFTLFVDATGATDLAGNAGVGVLSSTWTIDLDKPAAATNIVLSTFSGPVTDGKVNARQATIAGTLAEAGLTVAIRDMTTNTELARRTIAGTTFSLPIEFPSSGQHRLRVRTIDPAGNPTDTFIENLFVSETPPVVELVAGLPASQTRSAVDFLDLKFIAPIDPATLTKSALMITRNGGANLVNGTVAIVAQPDGRTFRFTGLSPITADEGRYELTLALTGVKNSAGLMSADIRTAAWINDHTAPTSKVQSLVFRQDLNSIVIDLLGSDPGLPGGLAPSGMAAFDLYYSDNGAPFQLLETLPANTPTTTFVAEPNHLYYFRSVARDTAGNIESKANRVDAWTYVPDLFAPQTRVNAVDTTDATFEVTFTGTDRGMGLRVFELFVQIDGGPVQSVGASPSGVAAPNGVYSAAANFQAISDGSFHQYRFFTRGTDWEGNVEAEADAPADVVVSARFAPPPQVNVVEFDVQKGADQRSFIRYLDVFFNTSSQLAAIINSLADGNSANDRIRLTRFGLDGSGPGTDVNLAGRVKAIDRALAIDFDGEGIGGDRNGAAGDGYYKLALDLDGNGSLETELAFFRLLGDADGDGDVDNDDLVGVTSALGQVGANLNGDLNGDGRVNALDRQAWQRGRGKIVEAGLHLDD